MWLLVGGAHAGLWGLSTLLFGVTLTGFAETIYAWFIEHVMSNMIWVVYIGSIVALFTDAENADDTQGFIELAAYVLIFGGAALYMELIHGMGAIKHLDPENQNPAMILWPSLLYLVGVIGHHENEPAEINIEDDGVLDIEDDDVFSQADLPFVSDPTA